MKNNILRQYSKLPFDRPYELVQTSLGKYFCNDILERDSDEVFKQGVIIDELYSINDVGQKEDEIDTIQEALEKYNKLVLDIKELASNNVPKDFIISYLKITEEIYDSALANNNDNY